MKKKILSLVLAISMLASLFVAMPVSADTDGETTIEISEITVNQGEGTEIVEVPIEIAGNTGVLGVQLQVKYGEGLTLTDVAKGDALSSLSFTAPGKLDANPIKIMWDGQDAVDSSNGVIATLTFDVPKGTVTDYAIEITEAIIVDKDINLVETTIQSGKISVVEGDPEPGPAITVFEITVGQGEGTETVEVPIVIEENTGVLGVQLRVKYAEGLTLTDVKAGDALSSLSFTAPGDFTANPIKILWDGQDAADTSNGVIAKLTFEVPKDKANYYTIEITDAIVVDEDINSVAVIVKNGKISVHAHEYGDWEEDGDNHKKACDCGDVITETHTWDSGVVTTPATCTQVGVKTYTCTACGSIKVEAIPMELHRYGDWEADGGNHKKACDCGDVITEAHTWDRGVVTTPATCTEDGVKTYTCTVCNATKIETIPAQGHTDVNNDHNCDICGETISECADGDNDHSCDICGKAVSVCADKDNDHSCDICGKKISECSWDEGAVTQEPTCTQNGVKTYTCTCGAQKTEEIPAKGHTYGGWTADGDIHKKTCSCGDTVTEAHTWDAGVVTVEPTYTQEGVKTYTCTACSATKTEKMPVVDHTHTWDEGVVTLAPTHTQEGVKTLTCTICGETKTEAIAVLPDHEWDEGAVTQEPTCTQNGVKTYTCTCGAQKTEEIPAKGHTYGGWTADGDVHKKTCSCGDTVTEAHAWDNGVVTTQPAYPQKGEKTYTCTVCGAKKTEVMEWVYNPGDPTDDGLIDTRDIISIRRYIAGGYNVVINLAGADADKDGMIDSRDIILIRRYLAGGYGVVLK